MFWAIISERSQKQFLGIKISTGPFKKKAYLVHLITNLSDLYTDINKIRREIGIPPENFIWLAEEREKERTEIFLFNVIAKSFLFPSHNNIICSLTRFNINFI